MSLITVGKNDRNDDNHVPHLRASGRGAYAHRCLRLFLAVPRLRLCGSAQAW
jgi:hypothetical protein